MDIARLFLWEGAALYFGPLVDVSLHKHHATQVTLGLSGPFRLFADGQWQQVSFARIAPDQAHQLDSGGETVALALTEFNLEAVLEAPNAITLPVDMVGAQRYFKELMGVGASKALDPRIVQAQALIAAAGAEQIAAVDLASEVGLSEGWFLHLFSVEAGLPLRRYILWRRIILSITAVRQGDDLTSAAHRGGFSDSAHFSRVFRETFGLSPSKLLKNSRNIQVFT